MISSDQIWVIDGREPVIWSVPVYLHWQTSEWGLLYFGVQLLVRQQHAVEHVLRLHAKPQRGMWHIRRTELEAIGRVVPHGDPEAYFIWERERLVQKEEYIATRNPEREEFLDSLYAKGVGASRTELEFYWHSFCNHALDTLLNKQRPVDMYFLRLHNCPMRQNWKLILLARFPKLGHILCRVRGLERDYMVHRAGLDEQLVNLDLLAMNRKTQLCYRHVEVSHRPSWHKESMKVEAQRHRRLGCVGYANYFLQSIRSRIRTTVDLYVEWLVAIARPSASDVECGHAGDIRLVPNLPPSGVRKKFGKPLVSHCVVPNSPAPFQAAADPTTLRPKEPLLREVPDMESPPQDLWDPGRELLPPDPPGDSPGGLLVLHAGEERPSVQLLGLQQQRGPDQNGMAG